MHFSVVEKEPQCFCPPLVESMLLRHQVVVFIAFLLRSGEAVVFVLFEALELDPPIWGIRGVAHLCSREFGGSGYLRCFGFFGQNSHPMAIKNRQISTSGQREMPRNAFNGPPNTTMAINPAMPAPAHSIAKRRKRALRPSSIISFTPGGCSIRGWVFHAQKQKRANPINAAILAGVSQASGTEDVAPIRWTSEISRAGRCIRMTGYRRQAAAGKTIIFYTGRFEKPVMTITQDTQRTTRRASVCRKFLRKIRDKHWKDAWIFGYSFRNSAYLNAKTLQTMNHSIISERALSLSSVYRILGRGARLFGAFLISLAGFPDSAAADSLRVSLSENDWYFALDPLERGESFGWHEPEAEWAGERPHPGRGWDEVSVPHSWSVEPRYEYTGIAWYHTSFFIPEESGVSVHRIRFDSVYQRCRVWVNGRVAGEHEGGHTPFEFVVSDVVRPGAYNLLAIEVDNRWDRLSYPGARYGDGPAHQVYPWWEYGGIHGAVEYLAHGPVYHREAWVDAEPDLENGAARVNVTAKVFNDSGSVLDTAARAAIVDADGVEVRVVEKPVSGLRPGEVREVAVRMDLEAEEVRLWNLDDPYLYGYTLTWDQPSGAVGHVDRGRFGIRSVEVRDGQFLLNGEPVRLAGATRARGNPETGGYDSVEDVRRDMALMKEAHFEMARIHHYAPSRALLDWADENGFLVIAEPPLWGLRPDDLASTRMREGFRREMRALLRMARSRPSVVAWALGNEYHSWMPQGARFTREMAEWVRSLDSTRPVTFVAHGHAMRFLDDVPENHGFHYVDFLCVNTYHSQDRVERLLDGVHALWPEKPVFVTEFGLRSDFVESEEERIRHYDRMLAIARERPWIMGLAYWSFNDYRSRYPGTNPDGFRHWGLVDFERRPRELYRHVVDVLTPFSLSVERAGNEWVVLVGQTAEIPSRMYSGLTIHLVNDEGASVFETSPFSIGVGEETEVSVSAAGVSRVELRYADGRVAAVIQEW